MRVTATDPVCTQSSSLGRVKHFRKVFAGGVRNFYFGVGKRWVTEF